MRKSSIVRQVKIRIKKYHVLYMCNNFLRLLCDFILIEVLNLIRLSLPARESNWDWHMVVQKMYIIRILTHFDLSFSKCPHLNPWCKWCMQALQLKGPWSCYKIQSTAKLRVLTRLVWKHMQAFSDCLWSGFLILM